MQISERKEKKSPSYISLVGAPVILLENYIAKNICEGLKFILLFISKEALCVWRA